MRTKDWIRVIIFLVIGVFLPLFTLFYLICGLLDVARNSKVNQFPIKRYFLGNGVLTWVLSPFNLGVDLLCHKNRGIYKLENLPQECQQEILQTIEIAKSTPAIIEALDKQMLEKKRGMYFFKWYGKNSGSSLIIPEFQQKFKYIRTIGVSIFNANQSTSIHFGPLRVTLRVLYNLNLTDNGNIYIKVGNHKHLWCDNPLFIFDDTLIHQSVNGSDKLRYCMFIDILRPSNNLGILDTLLNMVRVLMISVNRIFYKNWDMLK